MRMIIWLILCLLMVNIALCGCSPVRDAAGRVSDNFGEMSDELGKERTIGKGDDTIVIEPMADKKVKMAF